MMETARRRLKTASALIHVLPLAIVYRAGAFGGVVPYIGGGNAPTSRSTAIRIAWCNSKAIQPHSFPIMRAFSQHLRGGSSSFSEDGGAIQENAEHPFGILPRNKRMLGDCLPDHRPLCEGCKRPHAVCVCAALPPELPLRIKTKLIILQHPKEFKRKTIGTVPLIKLLLGPFCEVITCPYAGKQMGDFFSRHPSVVKAVSSDRTLLLFPALHPKDPSDKLVTSPVMNLEDGIHENMWGDGVGGTLVVIDGSWSQAKMIFKLSTGLHHVPRVQFSSEGLGEYGKLRSEPKGNYMSTLESVGHALSILEKGSQGEEGLCAEMSGSQVCQSLIQVQRMLVSHQKLEKHQVQSRFRRRSTPEEQS